VARPVEPPRPPRRGAAQELQSQIFLEILIHAYAIGGAFVLLRCLLLSFSIDKNYWIGSMILGITDLIADPLHRLPGSGSVVIGDLTLVDLTLLAGVAMFPIGIYALPRRRQPTPL
jgi:hypothetical protein